MNPDRQIVTFLFTDIEESTGLWEKLPALMSRLLARHNDLVEAAIRKSGGTVFKTVGDSICAAFESVGQASQAALDAQRSLLNEPWGEHEIRVRMAIHLGTVTLRGDDYEGVALSRIARLLSLAYGKQILISEAAQAVGADDLPSGCSLRDIGTYRLRGLERHEQVYQLLHPDLPSSFPPPRQMQETPTNLPLPVTSFVGREPELAFLRDALQRSRVVTITGSGGSGKSRLAMQLAADLSADYPQGVWHVDLADVTEDDAVAFAAATALLLRATQVDAIERVSNYLRNATALIVLDNCEQVRSGCRIFVGEIVQACPHVRIVAASREPMRIRGEQIVPAPPLTLPEQAGMTPEQLLLTSTAVRLFVERAASVSNAFRLTDKTAEDVAEICRRLDGIPLAIELVAARARVLSPRDLLRRIDRSLNEFAANNDGGPSRHATIHAAIDWSYSSLSPLSQEALIRLTVFKGGWTLEAAEEVCADETLNALQVVDELSNLVEKSLVTVSDSEENARRFAFLEIIRSFVVARRGGNVDHALLRRHAEYYGQIAQEYGHALSGPDSAESLTILDRERGNMLLAFDFELASGEYDRAMEIAESLWQFWAIRGYLRDGAERVKKALEVSIERTVVRAKVLMGAGVLLSERGEYLAAEQYLNESATILRELSETSSLAATLGNLAVVKQHQEQYSEASALCIECLTIYRNLRKERSAALILGNLGLLRCLEGSFDDAEEYLAESLRISRTHDMTRGCAVALSNRGLVRFSTGRFSEAKQAYLDSLTIFLELGDKGGIASSLGALARVAASMGAMASSVQLAAVAERLREEIGLRLPGWAEKLSRDASELTTQSLTYEAIGANRRKGRALSIDQALRSAREIH